MDYFVLRGIRRDWEQAIVFLEETGNKGGETLQKRIVSGNENLSKTVRDCWTYV